MSPQFDLRDYLLVLRRRKWIVLLAAATVVAAALGWSLTRTPVYKASTEIVLRPRNTESLFSGSTASGDDRTLRTEIRILRSEPIRAAVREKLGIDAGISAIPLPETDIIEISATSDRAEMAARIANAYADAYIDFRLKRSVDVLLSTGKQVQIRIQDLNQEIDALTGQLRAEYDAIAARFGPSAASGDNVDATEERREAEDRILPRRDALVAQRNLLTQRLEDLELDLGLRTGGAQVVTPASAPGSPTSPTPRRDGTLAMVVGLLLGVGLAFVFEHLDDAIKTKDDLERATGKAPVLAIIPVIEKWRDSSRPYLVSIAAPRSAAAEAYRSLRTSVQTAGLEEPLRSLQVTSPSGSEGKSTTVANLGVAMARAGRRVVMIDCDLRRPRLHSFFNMPNEAGLTSVLMGDVALSDALLDVPGEPQLQLLTSGPTPPNPSEVLSSRRVWDLFDALETAGIFVLLDAPPLLPVTDAAILATGVEATLLVTAGGSTDRRELQRAVELLQQVEAELVGTVLNQASPDTTYGLYGYGDYTAPPGRRVRWRGRHRDNGRPKAPRETPEHA